MRFVARVAAMACGAVCESPRAPSTRRGRSRGLVDGVEAPGFAHEAHRQKHRSAPLADELRAYLDAARGRPLVGVHVRTTDRDMPIHMGNTGFLGRGQRLLGSLDYTGEVRRENGRVRDAAV